MDKQFIRVIPFYSQPVVGEASLEPLMPVALWKCAENICEASKPGSPCDDTEGVYYTIAGDEVTFWCPLHWYEAHFGPHPGQRLVAMTAEQHAKEVAAHRERLVQRWQAAAERNFDPPFQPTT
jgi:hypothetical protein